MKAYLLFPILCIVLSSCASLSGNSNRVTLDLNEAWFNGFKVQYVTTDASDRDIAELYGANYAPRLKDAVPKYPKPPEVKTILERVYAFVDHTQANNVFASIPTPLGSESEDYNYSPIWLLYTVEWVDKTQIVELRSETEIFKAEAQGWVVIERTDVVINCPVISIDGKRFLQSPA